MKLHTLYGMGPFWLAKALWKNGLQKPQSHNRNRDATEQLEFSKGEDPDLAKINVEPRNIAGLVNILDSDLVRVVYGFGHGTCGIGK